MNFTDLLVILLFVGPAIVTVGLIAWLVWSLKHHRANPKETSSEMGRASADQPQGHHAEPND
jgi:hypothetical protein